MPAQLITVTLQLREGLSAIPVPFDPRQVFGKVRAPVKVTVNGYQYRSTIAVMGGQTFIPLRRSHRDAAGLEDGATVEVRIEADTEARRVAIPAELEKALAGSRRAAANWQKLSPTLQREHAEAIESAKKPETRQRRIARILEALNQ